MNTPRSKPLRDTALRTLITWVALARLVLLFPAAWYVLYYALPIFSNPERPHVLEKMLCALWVATDLACVASAVRGSGWVLFYLLGRLGFITLVYSVGFAFVFVGDPDWDALGAAASTVGVVVTLILARWVRTHDTKATTVRQPGDTLVALLLGVVGVAAVQLVLAMTSEPVYCSPSWAGFALSSCLVSAGVLSLALRPTAGQGPFVMLTAAASVVLAALTTINLSFGTAFTAVVLGVLCLLVFRKRRGARLKAH